LDYQTTQKQNPLGLRCSGLVGRGDDLFSRAFTFGLQHFAATVKAGGADVVTAVHFTRGWLNGQVGSGQVIMRTVHATLGGRFFVLLNGHVGLLCKGLAALFDTAWHP
jgi:hypothetical protein